MKNLLKVGMIAFAFSLMFVGVDSVNAQRRQREERREYREEVRDARRDYRQDIRRGGNRRKARHEYREEIRDARRDYRHDTGRRINRGRYYGNNNRLYNNSRYRVYYRNGRRYVVRY